MCVVCLTLLLDACWPNHSPKTTKSAGQTLLEERWTLVPSMAKSTRSDLRPIGDVVEDWLDALDGPARLAAFRRLPESMQAGAWEGLRRQIELERELGRAA